MPATKDAMTRYQILDKLLSNRYHKYSLDDLTEAVNEQLDDINGKSVTRRCIEKDLYYLEYGSPFMVDIERYPVLDYNPVTGKDYTKRCLRYRDPSYSIFHKDLSDDEVALLREAMKLLGQFDGLPNLESLEMLRIGLGIKKSDKHIISFAKNPLANSNLLGKLFVCISNKQVIELSYWKFSEPDIVKKIIVHPYLLKEYNRRWYLLAAADDDNKMLTFGLDRITEVTPLEAHKYRQYKGDIQDRYKEIIGVTLFDDKEVERVDFWVNDNAYNYISTKPIHPTQKECETSIATPLRTLYPKLADGHLLSIEVRENYELIRELCSFGADLIVLSPTTIRDKVVQRIESTLAGYES